MKSIKTKKLVIIVGLLTFILLTGVVTCFVLVIRNSGNNTGKKRSLEQKSHFDFTAIDYIPLVESEQPKERPGKRERDNGTSNLNVVSNLPEPEKADQEEEAKEEITEQEIIDEDLELYTYSSNETEKTDSGDREEDLEESNLHKKFRKAQFDLEIIISDTSDGGETDEDAKRIVKPRRVLQKTIIPLRDHTCPKNNTPEEQIRREQMKKQSQTNAKLLED